MTSLMLAKNAQVPHLPLQFQASCRRENFSLGNGEFTQQTTVLIYQQLLLEMLLLTVNILLTVLFHHRETASDRKEVLAKVMQTKFRQTVYNNLEQLEESDGRRETDQGLEKLHLCILIKSIDSQLDDRQRYRHTDTNKHTDRQTDRNRPTGISLIFYFMKNKID